MSRNYQKTKQPYNAEAEDIEPLCAELRVVFVGPNQVVSDVTYRLEHQNRLTIGRGNDCSIKISDETVSSKHASVYAELVQDRWCVKLRDEGSSFGTRIDGAKISDAVSLLDGNLIRVGNSFLVFRIYPLSLQDNRDTMPELVGCSPAIRLVRKQIEAFAPSSLMLLLQGETGVGKEVVAGAIHRLSKRKGDILPANSANLTQDLAHSQLFGHKKGSFTSAISDHAGLFVQAGLGTLFLDEIGELHPEVQPKLLRVLDGSKFAPLGEDWNKGTLQSHARVISASKVNLLQAVSERKFRDDLYFRLSAIRLHIPPLRERREDILLLAEFFLSRVAIESKSAPMSISVSVAERLLSYGFPGNVRELKAAIERAVAVARSRGTTELLRTDLPDEIQKAPKSVRPAPDTSTFHGAPPEAKAEARVPLTKEELVKILEKCGWKILPAATMTGWDRRTIRRWMKRYNLAPAKDDEDSSEP